MSEAERMLARFDVTRGLPGSGKTTWARSAPDAWVLGRDNFRDLRNGPWPRPLGRDAHPLYDSLEGFVTSMQQQMVWAGLSRGYHVICDDTLLNPAHVLALANLALNAGVQKFRIVSFTEVDWLTCAIRDEHREARHRVGAEVIEALHDEWIATGKYAEGLDELASVTVSGVELRELQEKTAN